MKRLPILSCALVAILTNLHAAPSFSLEETDAAIVLTHGDVDFLTYHKAEVPPPEGADPIFTRSGFIHPVKTPQGDVVTGIHPEDHVHHLGLWHAWVKCKIGDKEIDFWNLKARKGRVRYASTKETVSETDRVGFTVMQEHVAFLDGPDEAPTVILEEAFTVMARLVDDAFEIDYHTAQTNVHDEALELPAYRYGGPIAYRAPHAWDNSNSDYLGSEGTTRVDGHQTRSKWCAFWGPGDVTEDPVHLAILVHRDNHDFPQRMRVWPPSSNNGAIFFNYVPAQETSWAINAGETSLMRYRLVVQGGKPDTERLNQRWSRFAGGKKYWTVAQEVVATHRPEVSERTPAARAAAAKALLEALTDEQRKQTVFPLESDERTQWTNVPPSGDEGGLRLGDASREVIEKALDLLATSLSEQGYLKTRNILLADDDLLQDQAQADRRGGFGSANYWLLLFGQPSESEPWGLQFDGHHLAINLTMVGEKMSCSPAFIGTQPRAIQLDGKEIIVMENEPAYAFDFVHALSDEQRRDALKDDRRGNLQAGAGRDGFRPDPRGLDCSTLTEEQKEALMKLIAVWVKDLPEGPAAARLSEIEAQLDQTRFAWRGPFEPGSDASYHVYGPGVIIEYAGQDLGGDPAEHLHSIYRNPNNEYGAQWLAKP